MGWCGRAMRCARGSSKAKPSRACHPERSEGSGGGQVLRFAQDDSATCDRRDVGGAVRRRPRRHLRSGGAACVAAPPKMNGRAPAVDNAAQALPPQTAPARFAAAQRANRLPLLPSGPDGVQRGSLARDPTFNTTYEGQTPSDETSSGNSPPLERIVGYRAPLVPRLARPR